MKSFLTISITLFFFSSCDKPVYVEPQMVYTDLENKTVGFNESFSIDVNKDGEPDVRLHTLFDGDPISKQDKRKYLVSSKINCLFPINAGENAPLLSKGDVVPLGNFLGYTWYGIAKIELAQKVVGVTGDPFWEGLWKYSNHNYLPIQMKKDNKRFNGWVELSFDMDAEKVILHTAAISRLPESQVIAGI